MKLKIEHLSPYLPHGLQMIFQSKGGRIVALEGLRQVKGFAAAILTNGGIMWLDSPGFKPILRPLSDLTKEINHRGETFVPIDLLEVCIEWDAEFRFITALKCDLGAAHPIVELAPYSIHKKLCEWHFDVFGLIESGLAISVHDLEFNPYEK